MPDYTLGKIYKITAPGTKKTYVGSTCVSLKSRLSQHISDSSNKTRRTCSSRKVVCHPNHIIELLENYPCKNNDLLRERECYWLNTLRESGVKCCNVVAPFVSFDEAKVKNNIGQMEVYYANKENPEWCKKENKRSRKKHESQRNDIEFVKRERAYESIYRKQRIWCEYCNSTMCRGTIRRHKKSQKHINNYNDRDNFFILECNII